MANLAQKTTGKSLELCVQQIEQGKQIRTPGCTEMNKSDKTAKTKKNSLFKPAHRFSGEHWQPTDH